jgi:GNAT superfamily N-acetyltransferase
MENFLKNKNEIQQFTGKEKGNDVHNGISKYVGEFGSYRYLYRLNGEPISVLQIVSRDGNTGVIAHVYTKPEYRKQNYARKLLDRSKIDFDNVEHSQHLTEDGKMFKQKTSEDYFRELIANISAWAINPRDKIYELTQNHFLFFKKISELPEFAHHAHKLRENENYDLVENMVKEGWITVRGNVFGYMEFRIQKSNTKNINRIKHFLEREHIDLNRKIRVYEINSAYPAFEGSVEEFVEK